MSLKIKSVSNVLSKKCKNSNSVIENIKEVNRSDVHNELIELRNDEEGVSIVQETLFIDSQSLQEDEQIFENLKVKVEPVYVENSDDIEQIIETQNQEKNAKKVKKKKLSPNKVGTMKKKKVELKKSWVGRRVNGYNKQKYCHAVRHTNPKLDLYQTITDESGKEVKIKVDETIEERKRRLGRERMRRRRNKMSEMQRQLEMRKQRIQKQKQRLRERLEETEEQAEERKRIYREQKRKSRQRMQNFIESVKNEDSKRYLSSTSDGEIHNETPEEREKRLARKRQWKVRIKNEQTKSLEMIPSSDIKQKDHEYETDEDEEEIRVLKFELLKKQSKDLFDGLTHFNENDYLGTSVNLSSKRILEQDLYDLKKKRAPDDIEYLYFYENSEERRKRLDRERHKAKYVARKQMELEMLELEDECDIRTSRRCLDLD